MGLDVAIKQEIQELHQRWSAEAKLPTLEQLAIYYATFRQRFGPDALRSLDGEALLSTMHDHGNMDSLVYWLEFKDDDEFPDIFGSIAGGSALKFGIYRRKETGQWMAGSPQNQRVLSLDEAIQVARRNREQLIQGAQVLADLPSHGSDRDYQALQQAMARLAPDVNDSAWGHKYFSLLAPEKLDDYHNPQYQRFHLIKLLEVPPSGDGRYLVAGRYVAIARELGIPLNHLTTLLNERHGGRPYRYWRIGTSNSEAPRNRWMLMRDDQCIAIGWPHIGNLSFVEYKQPSKDAIRRALETHYPNTPQMIGNLSAQIFNFVAGIQPGDLVLAADGATMLGIGRVIGPYTFEPTSDFPHRRPVEWLMLDEFTLPMTEGLRTTVREVRKHPQNLVAIERRVHTTAPQLPPLPQLPGPRHVPRMQGIPGRIQTVLERKGQVILYGPPGTGKTYWAERTARDLAASQRYGVPFDQLDDAKRASFLVDAANPRGYVRLCSFHPAYGYEDFLEGYRPQPGDGSMRFVLRDGIFKRLCQDARAEPDQHFYLIIDEINRGDIPRIFGELLTVLERSKRGRSILLPLSGEPFAVPENVSVIGTMNTADRSIALLDTALRRRFGFVELMPDSSVLGNTSISGIPLGPWLDALNQRICAHVGRDARNLQVGHSYLMNGAEPIDDFALLARVVHEDIIPLLEEYCYEDYDALEKILGKKLVDRQQQRIRHELFDPTKPEDLVQALLAPAPEIATSPQAVASAVEQPEDLGDEPIDDSGDPLT